MFASNQVDALTHPMTYTEPNATAPSAGSVGSRLQSALPVLSATLLLLFFSVGELFRYFLAVLAVGGLYALVRGRVELRERWLLLYIAAFACFWIPMAISVVDGESPWVAATATARWLIYLLAALLWIGAFVRHGTTRALLAGAFAVLSFWTADALLQFVTGSNLFGEAAYAGHRLSGMMGPRLTVVLAILSPVFFHALLRFGSPKRPLWLLLFPYLLVILYGGSRIAWMLLAIGLCLYAALLWAMGARPKLRQTAVVVALVAGLTIVAVAQTDWLQQRVVQLGGLFSDDYALVNTAVNNRLPHWEAAARMYQEHPINGIGVKTYKFSYADYAGGDTVFRGQPHLFLLEVAAETGTIGLVGFALFLVLIASLLVRLVRQRRYEAAPWGFALLLAAFPLNATLSLYAHFMSALIWSLAMIFFAVAARESRTR